MQVRFLDEAKDELLAQTSFYEDRQKGLGERYRLAVQAATALAATHPKLGSPWKYRTRRVFPKGCPYSVIYRIEKTELVIFAVAHFSQRPAYWRGRK